MLRPNPFRSLSLAFSASLCLVASAQTRPASGLPPTAPTGVPAPQIAPLNATATQHDANNTHANRAEVRYASGLLSINADNSSLNQILREISRQTGMKITGGVREERVFGHYGPAAPEVILATLIDGTSTNMVLRETASNTPEELILTPRAGGPTPPNPNAPGFDDGNDRDDDRDQPPPQQPPNRQRIGFGAQGRPNLPQPTQNQPLTQNPTSVPPSVPQPANNVNGSPSNVSPTAATLPVTNSVPTDSIPTPSTTPPSSGIVDAPNPPDPGTVNPVATNPPVNPNPPASDGTATDPSAPKTPEQIFQQLQQLQQQRQQPTKPPQ